MFLTHSFSHVVHPGRRPARPPAAAVSPSCLTFAACTSTQKPFWLGYRARSFRPAAVHARNAARSMSASLATLHAFGQAGSFRHGKGPRRAWQPVLAQAVPVAGSGQAASQPGPAVPEVGWLWDRKAQATQTRQRLQEHNLRPKKALGQNFLLDDGILERIAAAADLSPGDPVLEIGPGTGNLTRHLLAAGAVVTAVEKDDGLFGRLSADLSAGSAAAEGAEAGASGEESTQQHPSSSSSTSSSSGSGWRAGAQGGRLRLVHGDILRQDLPTLLAELEAEAATAATAGSSSSIAGGGSSDGAANSEEVSRAADRPAGSRSRQQPTGVKVVANLPYNITKPCLLRMLPMGGRVDRLLFMLQDEVAVRLTARDPGGADWRAMNILTQYYSVPQYRFRIDRRCYHPVPGVHGAVVDFRLLPPGERVPVPSPQGFVTLVNKAFGQRRKVLRNALQPLYSGPAVAAALQEAGLSPEARAQDLTLQQFADLAWALHGSGSPAAAAAAGEGQEEVQEQE